jgi:hypothetical protein
MHQVRSILLLIGHVLKAVQHYDAEHGFICPVCDREFMTWAEADQVLFPLMVLDYILTCPSSTTKQIIALLNAPNVIADSGPKKQWLRSEPIPEFGPYLLTPSQHYYTNHCFGCSDCGDEFPTQVKLDEVHILFLFHRDVFFMFAFSIAMRNMVYWSGTSGVKSGRNNRWSRFLIPLANNEPP